MIAALALAAPLWLHARQASEALAMIRICAWCSRFLGEIPPLDDDRLTHGICDACVSAVRADMLRALAERKKEIA